MKSIRPLFPVLTHHCDVKEYGKIKKELINYAYEEKRKDSEGMVRSNVGGWHSRIDCHTSDNIIYSTLLSKLKEYFSQREVFKENTTF